MVKNQEEQNSSREHADPAISALIPHRPPFLWVDRIIEAGGDSIVTEKRIPEDLELFGGHYPGNPLLPGVLICEAIFQSGALLLAGMLKEQASGSDQRGADQTGAKKVPVLTKIRETRFKRPVRPGETIRMQVRVVDSISSVVILKGTAKVGGELAVKTEFSCALVALQRAQSSAPAAPFSQPLPLMCFSTYPPVWLHGPATVLRHIFSTNKYLR